MGIGFWLAVKETFGASNPGGCDRQLSAQHELGSDLEGHVRGTDDVARTRIGRERPFGDPRAKVGASGEERRNRKRLEVGSVERRRRVGLRKLLERLKPCVPCERLAARAQGLRYVAFSERRRLGHRRDTTLPTCQNFSTKYGAEILTSRCHG